MIKLIAYLLLLCCTQYVFPNDNVERYREPDTESHSDACLIYEFGFSRLVTVKVENKEEGYDIFICDENDGERLIKNINERIPILEWAFNDMPLELGNVEYEKSNNFSEFFNHLSIDSEGTEATVCSSYLTIIGNKDLTEKTEELKNYIFWIWVNWLQGL